MATAKRTVKKVVKKTTVKTAPKKTAVKSTSKKAAGVKKGSKYSCGVCGLAVTVDTACGCVEAAHLICCDMPMKVKK
jgi:hypothetical protein